MSDLITADDLDAHDLTPADVRRDCPGATAYGPPHAPYWRVEDLAPLLRVEEDTDL